MAQLPTMKLDVDYDKQLSCLEAFLKEFKTTIVTEADTLDALLYLNMDDEGEDLDLNDTPGHRGTRSGGARRRGGRRPRAAPLEPKVKYMLQLQEIANRERDAITIELDDLKEFEESFTSDEPLNLISSINKNCAHYIEIFSRAIDNVLPPETLENTYNDDVLDVILTQRRNRNAATAYPNTDSLNLDTAPQLFPSLLTRRYQVYFKPLTPSGVSGPKALAVRNVRGAHLGHLITVRGIATRVSDVKPTVLVNAYTCDRCGSEIFQEIKTKSFAPLIDCPSEECKSNDARGQLFMSTRASKFLPFQEIRIQEMSDQVPVGHIPRILTIHAHGAQTRTINPGEIVDVAGIFLPTPYTGFKAIKAGLLTDTYLEAMYVEQHKKQYGDIVVDPRTVRRIEELRAAGNLYDTLAKSIAPEIYGHEDVKKCLLLLLIGGATKELGDGMRIRGDINVCLMGDPGVAKSQLLKYICKVSPRGIYTTGRGSSGVGLTAAVMRDPVTDEMVLEGGALVLADNGICCIDEFDKMDDSDRTAIHEVMEQQTISISKAGITTSLNARTSILAAANPLYGRYNPKISPVENINLPAALLSRFDILFLILDTPSRENDEELGRHVTFVHMKNHHPDMDFEPLTPGEMRMYIAQARQKRPVIPKEVADYIVGAYAKMRKSAKKAENENKYATLPTDHARFFFLSADFLAGQFTHASPRTLLGIIRLSQALARLRFADTVMIEDTDEALRLIEASKASLCGKDEWDEDHTVSSKIYNIIRTLAFPGDTTGGGRGELNMRTVRERVLAKGFTDDQLAEVVNEYAALDVWQVAGEGTRLIFVGGDEEDMDVDVF